MTILSFCALFFVSLFDSFCGVLDSVFGENLQNKDLPAMLRTLGHILPGAPSLATDQAGAKKAYMKALRLVHPDKVDPNASAATKAKAQRIFTTLQQHKP